MNPERSPNRYLMPEKLAAILKFVGWYSESKAINLNAHIRALEEDLTMMRSGASVPSDAAIEREAFDAELNLLLWHEHRVNVNRDREVAAALVANRDESRRRLIALFEAAIDGPRASSDAPTLQNTISEALSVDGVNEDDAPEHFGNEAAHAWCCGYEAGQESICEVLRGASSRTEGTKP